MFNKILIANRGEIACRVAATARRMGIRTVAVYSQADAQAAHVAACDEAVPIGASPAQESYLNAARIIDAALQTGAQAIHPCYGFLSENPAFARACGQKGLIFIGPSAQSMEAMGLKAESKRLMAQAGVPLVPGYHDVNQDAQWLAQQAQAMGYPVLIKASAGGGGKGMRVVEKAADFAQALASCQREAQASFGNPTVLIEKYLPHARHIEVQIFGDTQGNVVHLFERDCSVQRRHQKVLEEAPAPGMTPQLREAMTLAAIAAAKAVNYVGAGTVEFIVPVGTSAGVGDIFYFMEMNTRLQVEHPVTEAVTGLDLVEWQLRVAVGEPLPLTQAEIQMQGHAMEARLCAENPEHDFLPSTGQLTVFKLPAHVAFERSGVAGVRVDAGVRAGDEVTPYYDAMLAKLIVHRSTRAQALNAMDTGLSQTHVVGVANNVQFLRHVVGCASFALGNMDTALIERERAVLFGQDRVGFAWAAASAVAHTLLAEQEAHEAQQAQGAWQNPWARQDLWRAFGQRYRRFDFAYAGQQHRVDVLAMPNGEWQLQLGSADGSQSLSLAFARAGEALSVTLAAQQRQVNLYRNHDVSHVFTDIGATEIKAIDMLTPRHSQLADAGRLSAPMPGKVVSFAVQVGDVVTQGQVLAVLNAMKMEHAMTAPFDGTVQELLYAVGDQVHEGAELLRLQARR